MYNIDYLRGAKEAFNITAHSLCENDKHLPSNELVNQTIYACIMTMIDIDKKIESIIEDMRKEEQRND